MALLTAQLDDPFGYGRIVRADDGAVRAIVEEKDCDDEQRTIDETNPLYAFDAAGLRAVLPRLSDDNAQGELYLTDTVALFAEDGRPVVDVALEDPEEAGRVNSLAQLSEVRWALQARILEEHLANGVRIEDPSTTMMRGGVTIGATPSSAVLRAPCRGPDQGRARSGPSPTCAPGPCWRTGPSSRTSAR